MLDRSIVKGDWRILFHKGMICNYIATSSDHAPIVLNIIGEVGLILRGFKFEAIWMGDQGCAFVMENA